jgi:hypothetical protein
MEWLIEAESNLKCTALTGVVRNFMAHRRTRCMDLEQMIGGSLFIGAMECS